jgi:hypothetical protein
MLFLILLSPFCTLSYRYHRLTCGQKHCHGHIKPQCCQLQSCRPYKQERKQGEGHCGRKLEIIEAFMVFSIDSIKLCVEKDTQRNR